MTAGLETERRVLKRLVIVLLISISLTMLLSAVVWAMGIGVSPSKLDIEASPLGSTSISVNVNNPSDEPGVYHVYVEGDCADWFNIEPSGFELQPEGSQQVIVNVSPPINATGEYDVQVCIIALIHNSELNTGCGVKVPTHVRIIPPPPLDAMGINLTGLPLLGVSGALIAGTVTGIVMWRRKRRFREI